MTQEIVVPELGESVTEATVAQWFKAVGDTVSADEPLVELETDKVTLEVPAPADGQLTEIVVESGADVEVGALLGRIEEGNGGAASPKPAEKAKPAEPVKAPESAPKAAAPKAAEPAKAEGAPLSPAVRKLVEENHLDASAIPSTGKDGRLTKGDVLAHLDAGQAPAAPAEARAPSAGPEEERVRMSRLRKRVAERLKEAQNTAAMLTTFNEVDMGALKSARAEYRDSFEKKYGVRLGYMSFFIKAAIVALKELPGSMPRSRATKSSTKTTTTSASPLAPPKAWSCRSSATPIASVSPTSKNKSVTTGQRHGTVRSPWKN